MFTLEETLLWFHEIPKLVRYLTSQTNRIADDVRLEFLLSECLSVCFRALEVCPSSRPQQRLKQAEDSVYDQMFSKRLQRFGRDLCRSDF